jgi:hypothetical protein
MPTAQIAPFFAGMHTKFVFLQDSQKLPLDVEKWSLKLNATKVNDGVCGEPRDRLWRYINWYDLNFTCKLVDIIVVLSLLRDVDNDDAGAIPLVKAGGLLILPPNQNRRALAISNVIIDDWEIAAGGRTERAVLTIPARAQEVKESRVF